ncbi:MAG TPA: LuxR C-terminal-related transcriptional regulator [Gemmatimonadaceae bacterium]|nr:LuxR C-terminal-related transcriptional regulator [Gemmatimonadaceae bacterium]
MHSTAELERGRASFAQRAWLDAFTALSSADRDAPLQPEDLERLATAAYLVGKYPECEEIWARGHGAYLECEDARGAARCAFWLGLGLVNNGEMARAGGWFARAGRLLEDDSEECVEEGLLLIPAALRKLAGGDAEGARGAFARAAAIGDRFGSADLISIGRLGQGQALIHLGQVASGVSLLDEAMVAATAGELSPIAVGIVYCAVIEECQRIFDLRRAQEWTNALTRWCDSQPDLVPYRGQCLVRRAEILRLHGEWREAMEEARQARDRLSRPPTQSAIGLAYYLEAELHRLRGEFAEAEEAYRESGKRQRRPRPGLAHLRLAQGHGEAASTAIRRLMDEADERLTRPDVLAAAVEIMLAQDDLPAARAASDELSDIAEELGAPFLRALADQAAGAVLRAEGDARGALAALDRALTAWQALEAPYESARVRVLLGLACRALGDDDAAAIELEAARAVFEELGAAPDLARLDRLSPTHDEAPDGLTRRELQVLRLVAEGKTNRDVAGDLGISEKTVARHVSNIFVKLGLSSRAAATAYAYRHDLV